MPFYYLLLGAGGAGGNLRSGLGIEFDDADGSAEVGKVAGAMPGGDGHPGGSR